VIAAMRNARQKSTGGIGRDDRFRGNSETARTGRNHQPRTAERRLKKKARPKAPLVSTLKEQRKSRHTLNDQVIWWTSSEIRCGRW
jgi:hypothetical protein